jgi:hypothetical protein
MAMIQFIFAAVNSLTYFGMTTYQTFTAIMLRIGSIWQLDEFDFTQRKIEDVSPKDV